MNQNETTTSTNDNDSNVIVNAASATVNATSAIVNGGAGNAKETKVILDPNKRDSTAPVWDMSQERMLMLNLFNQRFYFFMFFFSLVVAGAVNSHKSHMAKDNILQSYILTAGFVISIPLALALHYVYVRHTKILDILSNDATHPYTVSKIESPKPWWHFGRRLSANYLIGAIIPMICIGVLLVWPFHGYIICSCTI